MKIFSSVMLVMLCLHAEGFAQGGPRPFAELLEKITAEADLESRVDQKRLDEFKALSSGREAALKIAQAELSTLRAQAKGLQDRFAGNEKKLAQLQEQQSIAVGALGEVFGVVRQVAGDFRSQLGTSIVSAQYPGREVALDRLAEAKALPSLDAIKGMVVAMQREAIESGRIVTYSGSYVAADGKVVSGPLTRVGSFGAFAPGKFLSAGGANKLVELARQPSHRYLSSIDDYLSSRDAYTPLALDPSRGTILSLLVETPTLVERIHQGGVVGYVILVLLVIGLILALERFAVLSIVGKRIKAQLGSPFATADNPLGRILSVCDENMQADLESLELKIDEAIVKETPKLERGVKAIKLFAAIAPLLGLLGTVTGMIATFQSITMFGSGDPKLMAGGISQALVTTVLGLVAAIPLLLLHGVIAARSKEILCILDEQSIGILAERSGRGATQ